MNKHIRTMALAVSALLGAALLSGCNDVSTELKAPAYKTNIKDDETRMSAFKADFPDQYASYQKNNESEVMTEYKGSVRITRTTTSIPCPRASSMPSPT